MARRTTPSPQPTPPPALRGRLWVDRDGTAAFTEAGADLLTQIDACGSLSAAARVLGFSYRRAWVLLDGMNRRWPRPLATTATGGTGGGGAALTPTGRAVLRAYRDLQVQLDHLLGANAESFDRATRSAE